MITFDAFIKKSVFVDGMIWPLAWAAFDGELANTFRIRSLGQLVELLSSLVFEACRSCGDLAGFGSFNSVFERNACDDFGEVVKAA